MKVKCRYNCLEHIQEQHRITEIKKHINIDYVSEDLELGKIYTVYSLLIEDGTIWYNLCIDDDVCPVLLPHVYFDVTDYRVSKYWQLNIEEKDDGTSAARFLFDAWANDLSFGEKLIEDEEPEAVEIFQKYKSLMDNEFE